MKTMILLVVLGMVAMASCQTDCLQRGLDLTDCVSSLVWTISFFPPIFFCMLIAMIVYMQATAAGDVTQFCGDCGDELKDFYNDCANGVGVDAVDACKSLWG